MQPKPKSTFSPLTDRSIKALKPSSKPVTSFDGHGLYIEVSPKDKRVWRFKAKLKTGKAILMTLGEYPTMSLLEARQKREELREIIAQGKDPRLIAKEKERAETERKASTFHAISEEWLEFKKDTMREKSWIDIARRLRGYIYPVLGEYPIGEITPRQVFFLLRDIDSKFHTVAKRTKSDMARIFSYAIQLGVADRNPASELLDVLKPHQTQSMATISTEEIPDFLTAIEADTGSVIVKSAVKLAMMLFTRKSELINAEWSEVDFDNAVWTIPWQKMKMGRMVAKPDKTNHVVPLPVQAVAILKDLHRITGRCRYVFSTGHKVKDAPLGDATIKNLMDRCGYNRKMTVHGFRALATSWLDEQGYNRQAIERQLAHKEKGAVNQAYHRADYMDERRQMLQDWADHIDDLMAQKARQTERITKVA